MCYNVDCVSAHNKYTCWLIVGVVPVLGWSKELMPAEDFNHDMHELMFVYEVKERLTVALSVIAHLKDRKETRWHSFAENLDYPEKSKDWEIFVNSKMVDGELKIIHRELVNLCQVPAGNMACSVSPSPEATSNGLMFQGKGDVYEHSDK